MDPDSLNQHTLPWIEKYRPKTLDDIISHSNIVVTLQNFIKNNKLPHLLFHGPPGTGKTSSIIAVAKELYGSDYDVMTIEINASEERGIEVVRNRITQFATSKSMVFNSDAQNMYKLVILDEADAMTPDAQASLRRVIEKYTKNVRFCLICNYIKKIDLAIQSRCTCFRFSPLKDNYVKQKMLHIVDTENIKYTEDGLDTIVKRSKGDMRKILNILQSVSMSYDIVNEENVNKCLGCPNNKTISQIFLSLFNDSFNETIKLLLNCKDNGFSLMDIITEIHDILINIVTGNTNKINDKRILRMSIEIETIKNIMKQLGNIEHYVAGSSDEFIQLGGFVGSFKLQSQKFENN